MSIVWRSRGAWAINPLACQQQQGLCHFLREAGVAHVGSVLGMQAPIPPLDQQQPTQAAEQQDLAGQLLTSTNETLRHPQAVTNAVRQGRSPVAKKRLTPRGGPGRLCTHLQGRIKRCLKDTTAWRKMQPQAQRSRLQIPWDQRNQWLSQRPTLQKLSISEAFNSSVTGAGSRGF